MSLLQITFPTPPYNSACWQSDKEVLWECELKQGMGCKADAVEGGRGMGDK
jgi:hypothetical protein